MKSSLIIVIVILTSISCTRTRYIKNHHPVPEYVKMLNYLGFKKDGYIKLKSEKIIHTSILMLKGDSVQFYPKYGDSLKYINIDQIESVYFKDHFLGLLDGSVVGIVSGGGAAFGVGTLLIGSSDRSSREGRGWLTIGGAAVGLAVGGITGAIVGDKIEFRLISRKQTDK